MMVRSKIVTAASWKKKLHGGCQVNGQAYTPVIYAQHINGSTENEALMAAQGIAA